MQVPHECYWCLPMMSDTIFFKSNQMYLHKLALKYLSIPATLIPSERGFSTAGEVLIQKRRSLDDKNAEMPIFFA